MKPARTAPIPFDPDAEMLTAAFAVGDGASATAASEVVTGADFYDRTLGRIFDTAVQLSAVRGTDRRIRAVAQATGVRAGELGRMCDNRPAIRDLSARRAWLVRATARRRRLMAQAAELHNDAALADPTQLRRLASSIAAEADALSADSDARRAQTGAGG